HVIWAKLNAIIEEYLDSVTLEDLVSISRGIDSNDSMGCSDPLEGILDIVSGQDNDLNCALDTNKKSISS
ncbi:MAG: hypothetical protein WCG34_03325, partial [Leptolinea sp.]